MYENRNEDRMLDRLMRQRDYKRQTIERAEQRLADAEINLMLAERAWSRYCQTPAAADFVRARSLKQAVTDAKTALEIIGITLSIAKNL